jgi:hypothetical protein
MYSDRYPWRNIIDWTLFHAVVLIHKLLVPSRRFLGHMLIFLCIEFSSERRARNIGMLSSLERPTNCHNRSTQTKVEGDQTPSEYTRKWVDMNIDCNMDSEQDVR